VNAAGLSAQRIAHAITGLPKDRIPGCFYAKGHYFVLSGSFPFRAPRLPGPRTGRLGVHVTLDLSGQARFGPDVSWVDVIDYDFDVSRAASFYAAIRAYFPTLADGASCRATRAFGRSSAPRELIRTTSSSRGRAITAYVGHQPFWHRVARIDGGARHRRPRLRASGELIVEGGQAEAWGHQVLRDRALELPSVGRGIRLVARSGAECRAKSSRGHVLVG